MEWMLGLVIFVGGPFVLVMTILLTLIWLEGHNEARNSRGYRNGYKKRLFAWTYEKGYQRGEYIRFKGDSDDDRKEKNMKRFGR